MMVGHQNHRNVCDLFNNVHPERNTIVQSIMNKFKETGHIKDIPRG